MDAKDKIIKAKVRLQKDNPFFAYLVMNLRFSEDETIGTIGVNFKGDCKYNAKFIESLSDESLKGVLAHEVLHLALQHLQRQNNRNQEVFNIACDLVINNILINSQFTLPNESGGLIPYNNKFQFPNFEWIEDLDKKTAEQVYMEIYNNEKLVKKVCISELDGKRFDKHIRGEGTPQEIKESDDKWKKAFSEASCYAKQQGKLPKGIDRLLDVILNERVNWKQLLYKYLTRTLPYDYTYSRPSKKSFSSGFYMPSILRESIEVVVSVDTSGSISQDELGEFLGEIINIARSFNNIKIKLIVCDCEIKEVYDFSNGDIDTIMNLKFSGGGGTSHKPVYEYLAENLPSTKLLVNLTDGYTEFPDEESFKTIWVLTKNGCDESKIPFGEVIKWE